MKRQLPAEGASPSHDSSRRAKVRRGADTRSREHDELATGELDLNSTPRGFDLNAPVPEEEELPEQSGWQNDSLVSREPPAAVTSQTVPEHLVRLDEAAVLSAVKAYQPVEVDDTEKEAARISIEAAKVEVIEEHATQAGIATSSKPAVSIVISPETSSSLGIDEDLDIIHSAWAALQQGNMLALDTVLADACEELIKNAHNLSRYHLLSCLYISKKIPDSFRLPRTYQIILSFLSYSKGQPAVKKQNLLPSLACKLLHRAFASEVEWPLDFVEHYLEDAIGVRAWIENDGCREFVSNVLSAFPDPVTDGPGGVEEAMRQDQQGPADLGHGPASQCPVRNRYPRDETRQRVRTEFLNALNQLLATNATKDNPRVLLRLLVQGAGYEEVRVLGSSMLESWLNNPVHVRLAKTLLDRIVKHTHATSENDFNTVANLLALRVTSLQVPAQMKSLHGSIFSDMVSQLVRRRSEYATLALKTFVTAEINNKNAHNVKSIATVLKAMPDCPPPEQELALILQELAANEDSRAHLRDLARRIMKQASSDINVHALCHGLMQPWPAMEEQLESVKESWLKQIVDLVCQLLLHAVAQYATDEGLVTAVHSLPTATASGTYPSGSGCSVLKEKLSVMEKFSMETANLQEDAMAWCTEVLVVYLPRIQESNFLQTVRQLLFLEGPEVYLINSESTGDLDMLCYKLLTSCLRAPEEILARLILMGISSYPLTQAEAMKIIEGLVWRAAKLQNYMDGALTAKSDQLPAAIFKLSSANLSPNTRLQFVLKDLYWRAAIVVLTIAVCNPMTIGHFVWLNCPTIRIIMEVILTGGRNLSPLCGDGADKVEADKLELEAIQRDVKAEEAISAFYAAQASSEVVTPVPWPFQGEEWRGNVMVFNPGGPTRQPPITVLQELNHIDEVYQLGSMLRRCRSPNFFSEMTSSQTLRQAWPWLEEVILSDPDVMVVLPCLWQCELFYMHETSSTTSERQTLDLSGVRSNLHMILTQESPLFDVDEVNIVVSFLARKLASRNSMTRYSAHCCFTKLFTEDFDLAVADFAGTALSEKGRSAGGVIDPENCEWLEMVDGLATKFRVIEALAPTLQLAIQTESNIHVVVAYLDFLQKHLACLPSSTSLTCCLSVFVVQRKSLAACLLANFSAVPERTGLNYPGVANFLLQTILTAIQLGTGCDQGWSRFQASEVPVITLVSPRASTVQRVEVHKMVVDAAIQLLAWLANNDLDATKQAIYDQLLGLLLPGFMHCNPQVLHDDRKVAWLETAGGQRFPLLSEEQATSFAHTKDARVLSAAFSVLSLEAKLDILSGLGLSTSAGSALLEEFDGVPETRLTMVLSSKGVMYHKAKKIRSSVILLQNSGSHGGSNFLQMLQRHIAASVQGQGDVHFMSSVSADPENVKHVMKHQVLLAQKEIHGHHSGRHELLTHASELFSGLDMATDRLDPKEHQRRDRIECSKYVCIRKILAKSLLLVDFEDMKKCLESMVESLAQLNNTGVAAISSMVLSLPVLSFLWYCRSEEQVDYVATQKGCKTRLCMPDLSAFQVSFSETLSLLHSWLHKEPGDGNPTNRMGKLHSVNRAAFIVEGLRDLSWRPRYRNWTLRARLVSWGDQKPSFSLLAGVPVQKFETELLAGLCLTSSPTISWTMVLEMGKKAIGENMRSKRDLVIEELIDLLKNWQGGSVTCQSQKPDDHVLAQQKQVELCGRFGLVVELLLFIDPELQSEYHLQSVLGLHAPGLVAGSDLVPRELEAPSHAKLALDSIFHKGSWITISRIISGIFSTQGNLQESHEQDPRERGNGVVLADSEACMEFVGGCMQHPHAQLGCRTLKSNLKDIRFQLVTSCCQPSSVQVLVNLVVIECSVVRLLMQKTVLSGREGLDHDLSFFPRLNRGLRLIMSIASEGPDLMSAVIQELTHFQKGKGEEILSSLKLVPAGRDAMRKAIKLAASYLIWSLYSAFPVSVTSICGFGGEEEIMAGHPVGLVCPPDKQVTRLDHVLHNSLSLTFGGDERDSNAAYDFLHKFGRQHPSLVVPHLPMLALHLKNMLPLVKQGDNQVRSTAARTLACGIELLNALRPYLLEQSKMDAAGQTGACSETDRSSKSNVEVILALYFEFLRDLDVQDRSQFAKVVARVADFLCHCVAAGGRCRQFVMSYHKPLIQTAAQTFGKIKKLGYLLNLLENVGSTANAEEPIIQEHDEMAITTGALTGPSLPVNDVLRVRKQILQCMRWQTPDNREDSDFRGPGKELHYSPRYVHGLYVEEVEDVNLNAALGDLERASARMPTLLPLLQDSLLELCKISDSNIRDKAYSLLQRQLVHCPSKGSADKIARSLLQQLTSSQVALAKSAARHVSSFFHCCPEFQEVILVEMLKLGRPAADDLQQLVQGLFTIAGET